MVTLGYGYTVTCGYGYTVTWPKIVFFFTKKKQKITKNISSP